MKVKINKRLETVAELVENNSKVIDIGCDHALLDIYLVEIGKCDRLIASDNKSGPLKGAQENIKKYKLENNIVAKLGDGVDTIEDDIDTIIISGMGGLNIVGILKYKTSLYKQVKSLVLSPNSDVEKVRKEICKLGFYIENEKLVKDKNIIYPVILFKRGRKHYSKKELLFGPVLLKENNSLFNEYVSNQKIAKENLFSILPRKYFKRRLEIKRELKLINKLDLNKKVQ